MNTAVMLDIGIGLVIVYIAGALLVSGIQELLASLLRWRAKDLKEAILQMMLNYNATNSDDPEQIDDLKKAQELRQAIYNNALVQSLNHTSVTFLVQKSHKDGTSLQDKYKKLFAHADPSYLPSTTFATVLIQQLQGDLARMLTDPEKSKTSDSIYAIQSSIKNSDKIPNSLKETLISLTDRIALKTDQADNKLLLFQQEIEAWFDRSMQRASGVYKRNTQLLCFSLGFLVTILFNLDSIYIAERLSYDTAMRTTLAGGAETIIQNSQQSNGNSANTATPSLNQEKLAANINAIVGNTPMIAPITENAGNLVDCPNNNLNCPIYAGSPNFGKSLSALLGWLITAMAIYMGAPFWFDVLGKFVNVRSTGGKSK
ncbi:MAG: hypothetical protein VKJ02_03480 [Snowella sp.]|nr:hypothetical protein [Snowella sp.]